MPPLGGTGAHPCIYRLLGAPFVLSRVASLGPAWLSVWQMTDEHEEVARSRYPARTLTLWWPLPTGFGVHFFLRCPQAWPDVCAYYPWLTTETWLRISVRLEMPANTGNFPTWTLHSSPAGPCLTICQEHGPDWVNHLLPLVPQSHSHLSLLSRALRHSCSFLFCYLCCFCFWHRLSWRSPGWPASAETTATRRDLLLSLFLTFIFWGRV